MGPRRIFYPVTPQVPANYPWGRTQGHRLININRECTPIPVDDADLRARRRHRFDRANFNREVQEARSRKRKRSLSPISDEYEQRRRRQEQANELQYSQYESRLTQDHMSTNVNNYRQISGFTRSGDPSYRESAPTFGPVSRAAELHDVDMDIDMPDLPPQHNDLPACDQLVPGSLEFNHTMDEEIIRNPLQLTHAHVFGTQVRTGVGHFVGRRPSIEREMSWQPSEPSPLRQEVLPEDLLDSDEAEGVFDSSDSEEL